MDKIDVVNSSDAMFLRIDMPGHIRHDKGDTFSEIYLSYVGRIKSDKFLDNFAPDERYNFRRDSNVQPKRFIRAYRLRDPKTGKAGTVVGRYDALARKSCTKHGAINAATFA